MKFWDDGLQTQYFFWIIWDGITLLLENHFQGSVKIITLRYKKFSLVWQVISESYYTTGITKPCTHLHPAPSQNPFLGKFGLKNSKLSVSENWYTYYLKDADSESRLRFLKCWPQNPFSAKFGPKRSKLFVLSENWYTWYLQDPDFYSNISFLNFKS